jgi:hypothetical protein
MDIILDHRKNIRYTLSQALALNSGRVSLPKNLEGIFGKYCMPPCAFEKPYNNQQNIRFYDSANPRTYAKSVNSLKGFDAYSDESFLSKIRRAFASIAKDKTQLPIVLINQMIIPANMAIDVAKLFFDTAVQSPKKAEEFIEVLFGISFPDNLEKQIHMNFVKYTLEIFRNPMQLEATSLESGEARTKSHRNGTCILMARLFAHTYSNQLKDAKLLFKAENLKKKFLDHMFACAESGDADEVKNLVDVLPILMPKYQSIIDTYSEQINALYTNKDRFKVTVRLLLKDFLRGTCSPPHPLASLQK